MSLSTQEILDSIAGMSVMEVVQLIEAMEEKFGVSAATMAMPMGAMPAAGQGAAAAVEQTEFNVIMSNFGSNKVNVIKEVRAITGLGLKEAKDLVEALPATIKEAIKKEDADKMKKALEEAGATVEIK